MSYGSYDNSPPDYNYDDSAERARSIAREQEEIKRKNTVIGLVVANLESFFSRDILCTTLLSIIKSENNSISLYKKYIIATAISNNYNEKDLSIHEVGLDFLRKIINDIFEPTSELYQALNYQRNLIPISFFGVRHVISFNYAKTLQAVQQVIPHELIVTGIDFQPDSLVIRGLR